MSQAETAITTTRRKMLAGLAAVPLAAVPAAAITSAAFSTHPDADLFAMEAKAHELDARDSQAWGAFGRIDDVYADWLDQNPAPKYDKDLHKEAGWSCGYLQEFAARRKGWREADAKVRGELGHDAAHAAASALSDELQALCRDIAKIRATTLDGLKAKARLAECGDQWFSESIVEDLLEMDAGGVKC